MDFSLAFLISSKKINQRKFKRPSMNSAIRQTKKVGNLMILSLTRKDSLQLTCLQCKLNSKFKLQLYLRIHLLTKKQRQQKINKVPKQLQSQIPKKLKS